MSNITSAPSLLPVDGGYPSTSFLTLSSALVFIMTPGLGLFYSGLVRSKYAVSTIFTSYLAAAIVTFQWFLWGYSLSFSETSTNSFIGNLRHFALMNVNSDAFPLTAPSVPGIAFVLYQLQFAIITPAIIFGSVAERVRLLPSMVFVFLWTTLVYDFSAYWNWSARGWLKNLSCLETTAINYTPCGYGAYDFAGGVSVHLATLAFSLFLGKRKKIHESRPHNVTLVYLGTALLWFGWFGFNAGSAITSTARAAMAGMVTTICASTSGLAWLGIDFIFNKKLSGVAFCVGAITGLVVITPSSGFVSPWASFVIGILGAGMVYPFVHFRGRLGYDDVLDAFPIHGVGGFVGNMLTGIFHQKWIPLLDSTKTMGGAIEGNAMSLAFQLTASATVAAWSVVMTLIILFAISRIPGLSFEFDENKVEPDGADLYELGEIAYVLGGEGKTATVHPGDIVVNVVKED